MAKHRKEDKKPYQPAKGTDPVFRLAPFFFRGARVARAAKAVPPPKPKKK